MKYSKGDIVIITERYRENDAIPGQIVKIITIDKSDVPFEVTDFLDIYDWSLKDQWCVNVRIPTEEELIFHKLKKSNSYEIY